MTDRKHSSGGGAGESEERHGGLDSEAGDSAVFLATRTDLHMVQRTQIGLAGLVAVLLVVGLANIVVDQLRERAAAAGADLTDDESVAESEEPQNSDPLVDAGVVPNIDEEPSDAPPAMPDKELAGDADENGEAGASEDGAAAAGLEAKKLKQTGSKKGAQPGGGQP